MCTSVASLGDPFHANQGHEWTLSGSLGSLEDKIGYFTPILPTGDHFIQTGNQWTLPPSPYISWSYGCTLANWDSRNVLSILKVTTCRTADFAAGRKRKFWIRKGENRRGGELLTTSLVMQANGCLDNMLLK